MHSTGRGCLSATRINEPQQRPRFPTPMRRGTLRCNDFCRLLFRRWAHGKLSTQIAPLLLTLWAAQVAVAQTPTSAALFGLPAGSVEQVARRTESVKHYQLPNGSYVAVLAAGPLHYADASGTWQDIDATFHDDGGGGLL